MVDCNKVGKLIFALRKEKGMTQRQLAERMNISDKTISKWERGLGCPDVSLLHDLSVALNVNIEKILLGDLEPNNIDGGNMKRLKFYMCPNCGNVITATSDAEVCCCGRKMAPLVPKPAEGEHCFSMEYIENDLYITFPHEMKKDHYISFIAYVTYDKVLFVKLYPEQGSELRIPRLSKGKLYFGCSKHGLWVNEV